MSKKSSLPEWTFQTAYRDAFYKGENPIEVHHKIMALTQEQRREAEAMLKELGYAFD